MARKSEFLDELQGSIQSLKDWGRELREDVNEKRKDETELVARRQTKLDELAKYILPNLGEETLAAAYRKLPDFVLLRDVEILRKEEQQLRIKIAEKFKAVFHPETYEVRVAEEKVYLENAESQLELFGTALQPFNSTPHFKELISVEYGTDAYDKTWLELGYYLDWKNADEAVEALHAENWEEVRTRYAALVKAAQDEQTRIDIATRALQELDRGMQQYQQLEQNTQHFDETVLEKLRVQLRAYMDSLSETYPESMHDVEMLNEEIKKTAVERSKLEEQRAQLTGQMSQLQKLHSSVSQSRRREVPDEYIERLRSGRQYISRSSGSSPTVVHHYHNYDSWGNWFQNYLFYDMMFDHFEHQRDTRSQDAQINEAQYGRVS